MGNVEAVPRLFPIATVVVGVTAASVAPAGALQGYTAKTVGQAVAGQQASDSLSVLHVVQTFMTAAGANDSITIAKRSTGDQPEKWVAHRRKTPEFFDQMRVLKEMDFESPGRSKVLVSFSVRYRTFAGLCERRVPEDELNFELSKRKSRWTIDRIWSPIC